MSAFSWQGKKVFVTGHTGFKGAWLCTWLKMLGAEVKGYSLPPGGDDSLFEKAAVASGMISEFGDIRDQDALASSVATFEPDVLFHLAAQSLVKYSYDHPVETYATNVMGTLNVLEAMRATPGIQAAVLISSDKCYENQEWDWGYRESDPMGGYDIYSSSKGCMEILVSSYRRSFFSHALDPSLENQPPRIASARAGNVIGGGDFAENRLIPDIVRALIDGKDAIIRNPGSVRPWQHVLEPLSGYMKLAAMLCTSDNRELQAGWNFGPEQQSTKNVAWIADKLVSAWGDGGWITAENPDEHHEAKILRLDSSKSAIHLDWHPRLHVGEALTMVVEWHKAEQDGRDMLATTLNQIEKYQALEE